ncbi:RNA polymerase sigma factor [bacterium]|nr:RNA polymerase sigma factor [bacterium]
MIKEKLIIHKIKKGDKKAFGWFYNKYAPRIFRFIYLKTNSIEETQDLTSETFLKFWNNLIGAAPLTQTEGNCPQIENPKAFLYQIARNLVIDFYRRKDKKPISIDDERNNLGDISENNNDLIIKSEINSEIEEIKKALLSIKQEYRDIIILRYLEEFSIKQISKILNKSEGAIRVALHRGLRELRGKLEKK